MNNLNVKIVGNGMNPLCAIDGNQIVLKKDKYGVNEGTFQTDKEEVQITIYRYLELSGRFWWLMYIIFFLISIFGICNPPYDRKCIQIEYVANIRLKENTEYKFVLSGWQMSDKAITSEGNGEIEEIENKLVIDKKIKRRLTIIRLFKIIAWIGLIILAVFLIVERT